MDDQGFEFNPVRKDPPKRFEPPPWEREAFEELERKRAEKASAEQMEAVGPEPAPEPVAAERVDGDASPGSLPTVEAGETAGRAAEVSEAKVLEMLAALAEEEPAEPRALFAIGMGAGLLLVAMGGVLIVWAMAALVGSAETGWAGQVSGAGIGIFGVFFLAIGVWMMYRTLKRRGVL